MSLLDLLRRRKPPTAFTPGNPLASLSGTNTARAEDARAVMADYGRTAPGMLETIAHLEHQRHDGRDAVAVAIDGTTIGYISTIPLENIHPAAFNHPIPVQLFSELVKGKERIEAWAWIAPTPPEWEWSADNRPPMTTETKSGQRHEDIRRMLTEQATSNPAQAASIAAGTVGGSHYLELIEPIKQAKREGRLEDALALAYQAIQGAENGRQGREPAPAYTEHAAIILRKLGRLDEEAVVLERYLAWLPLKQRPSHRLGERLAKVQQLQKAQR